MLIFNTSYHISQNFYNEWFSWLRSEHIPFMLASGKFRSPQLAKIIQTDETDGSSYSLQFNIENMDELLQWHEENGQYFDTHCSRKFGSEVLFFSTVLEIAEL